MNENTWNQFSGLPEILLICLAAIGFLSVVTVIVTATKRVNRREEVLSVTRRLQSLDPEESVLSDTKVGLTDPD